MALKRRKSFLTIIVLWLHGLLWKWALKLRWTLHCIIPTIFKIYVHFKKSCAKSWGSPHPPANDLNKSLTSFTYTLTCTPNHTSFEKQNVTSSIQRPEVPWFWSGEPRQETGKLLPLPPWTATGAADRGQGLFRAPLMHCSWKATARFHAVGMIPESPAPRVSLTRAFHRKGREEDGRRGHLLAILIPFPNSVE